MADNDTPLTADKETSAASRRHRTQVNPDESNREKFVRLAQGRTGTAIDSIRKIALLGNKSQYEYTEEDITAIKQALDSAVGATIKALNEGRPTASTFVLPS